MKPHRQYIIMCILSLLFLAGCRDEEAVLSAEGKRSVTVSLGIAMSRATDIEGVIGDNTRPDNLQLWIFDGNGNTEDVTLIFHENITENLTFSITDLNNRLVQTIERIINVENEINILHFYIVMNTTGISLDENSTPHDIETATFTQQTTWTGDNKVPLYGYGTLDVSTHRSEYSVSIEATRTVGKLELFFTKENATSYLKVNNIQLEHVPDKGYLTVMPDPEPTDIYTKTIGNILAQETIILTSSNAEMGNFGGDEAHFTLLDLTQDYLLENPNGGTWAEVNRNNDYTYTDPYDPDKKTDNDYIEGDIRYKMTVTYQTVENGEKKTQVVYLPEIKRNYWNKIFVRVKDDGKLAIQYKVLKWEEVETSKVGYAPQPAPTNDCPFDDAGYTDFINGNYYILLPLKAYANNQSTKDLFHDLYMNPKEGDNEARLCILTRPTYDDEIDNNQHWALKTGSAGARYYFMLTGPEGATWEARLSNKKDFAFSISNTSDFSGNSDGYASSVRKVTHGIARSKPYIIEVIATHLYTGYKTGMTGQPEQDVEPRFDDGFEDFELNDPDDWKEYFDDTYLTAWGKAQEAAHQVAETDFYIVVKLQDGSEYELTINPSYLDYDKISANNFAFQNKRRYAGTDTRIKIRHVRAEHNIANLEELAKHEEGNWRKYNPDWNSDYTWN